MTANPALHDTDFYAWTQDQAAKIRRSASIGGNLLIDWKNVAEEIEDMGRSERSTLKSLLRQTLFHLLKLEFSPAENPRPGWRSEVRAFRKSMTATLEDSPSLNPLIDEFADREYRNAVDLFLAEAQDFAEEIDAVPDERPYRSLELLDFDWFPENRHGLK